jgi:hypothetical protein
MAQNRPREGKREPLTSDGTQNWPFRISIGLVLFESGRECWPLVVVRIEVNELIVDVNELLIDVNEARV